MAYLQCGAKDAAMFDETDGSDVEVSKRLDRKVRRLISRKAKDRTVTKAKKIVWRVAIAAMLIMSVMFTLLISISGVREALWNAIIEWHENYITIRYDDPEKENDTQKEADSNAAVTVDDEEDNAETKTNTSIKNPVTPPVSIEEVRKPTYLLDGVVEDAFKTNSSVNIDYFLEDAVIYSFSQFVLNVNEKYFDNETATVRQISIDGHLASVVTYENNPETSIVWNDGEYVYVLVSSVIDVEQMTVIAESVRAE